MGNVLGEHLGAAAVSCAWCAGGRPGRRIPDGPLMLPGTIGSPHVGSPHNAPSVANNVVIAQTLKRTPSGKNVPGLARGLRRKRTSTLATLSTASDGFQEHSESEEDTGTSEDESHNTGVKKSCKDLEEQRISEVGKQLFEEAYYVGILSNKSCKLSLSEDGKQLKWLSPISTNTKKDPTLMGSLSIAAVSKVEVLSSNDKALKICVTERSGAPVSHTFAFKSQKIRQKWEAAFFSLLPKKN